jgi:hypothetical protein
MRIIVAFAATVACAKEPFKGRTPRYTVVSCCDSQGITVFPFDGAAFTIPLPFVPKEVVFSPNGDALYAMRHVGADPKSGSSIVKIEFHPTRVNPVWESPDLDVGSFAVSLPEDKIVVAERDRRTKRCGLSENQPARRENKKGPGKLKVLLRSSLEGNKPIA